MWNRQRIVPVKQWNLWVLWPQLDPWVLWARLCRSNPSALSGQLHPLCRLHQLALWARLRQLNPLALWDQMHLLCRLLQQARWVQSALLLRQHRWGRWVQSARWALRRVLWDLLFPQHRWGQWGLSLRQRRWGRLVQLRRQRRCGLRRPQALWDRAYLWGREDRGYMRWGHSNSLKDGKNRRRDRIRSDDAS